MGRGNEVCWEGEKRGRENKVCWEGEEGAKKDVFVGGGEEGKLSKYSIFNSEVKKNWILNY